MTSATPVIITDSSCDLPAQLFDTLGADLVKLHFTIDGTDYADDFGRSMPHADFYRLLRAGAMPTTTAVPIADYIDAFTRAAEEGRPAILLGLAAALSSSHEASLTAAQMVMDGMPGADIRVVDTLNASAALGFFVYEAARRVADGLDIDTLEAWALAARHRVNGYFTVESLEHLRRGGRISDVVAFAGSVLDLRPVIRLDERGGLVPAGQARGRRKSMKALADIVAQRAEEPEHRTVFIAHGDAPDDAAALEEMVLERAPFCEVVVCELGPVIASHAGPGMLAVVFEGPER